MLRSRSLLEALGTFGLVVFEANKLAPLDIARSKEEERITCLAVSFGRAKPNIWAHRREYR
eukprot:6919529-Pyramimonas_sp.AAC.1